MSLAYTKKNTTIGSFNGPTTPEKESLSTPVLFSPVRPSVPYHSEPSSQHLYVLPVLLLEFLALALTRAVLPSLLLEEYGNQVYMIMGVADCVRGILAFVACPYFGKVSDYVGRKICLFITVLGTCTPVCSLALFDWERMPRDTPSLVVPVNATSQILEESYFWTTPSPPDSYAITVFVVLLALSGVFSSTFTLVFAYIADTVHQQEDRVSAYGLALATFGLSFTIGPILGGYLAETNRRYVFGTSLVLTVLDLLYIYFVLPESRHHTDTSKSLQGISWNPLDTIRIVTHDPFLRQVARVSFLYYTGMWAVISTLSVYAVQHFRLSSERLGELISVLGLCTMVAEVVLVRVLVPLWGETRAMRVGLLSFAGQCLILGLAWESWQLFVCVGFSILGNLVYPSLTSLVSGVVPPDQVGQALGAINGIKALTEGIGPLVFGILMTLSENAVVPGWPYLLAGALVLWAYRESAGLQVYDNGDYVHELVHKGESDGDDEMEGLLSEVEESGDDQSER